MRHVKALGIKFIFTAIVVYSLFGIFYNASMIRLFWISLLVTGVAYIIGDLFILRKFGHIAAVIADFGLAFLSIWVLANLVIEVTNQTVIAAVFAAVFVAVCESIFHIYLKEQVFNEPDLTRTPPQFQTEFAEDTSIDKDHDTDK